MSEIVYCHLSKDIVEAVQICLERIKPNATHWNEFAYACSDEYKYRWAKDALYKAVYLAPQIAESWVHLGWTHHKLQEKGKAVEAYQKAVEIQPQHTKAWNQLIGLYTNLKRYRKAENAYQKLLELEPDNIGHWNSFGNLLSDKLKEFYKAIACFDKVIENEQRAYWAIFNKGLAYRKMEKYEEAILWFKKSLEVKPDYESAWNSLGTCYLNMRNFEEAERCYQYNLDHNKHCNSSVYNMGCLHAIKGNKTQALHFLAKALEDDYSDHFLSWASQDVDFKNLWEDADFIALIEKYKKRILPF
jgi:tetratricopeptide (TPR) repeat protein